MVAGPSKVCIMPSDLDLENQNPGPGNNFCTIYLKSVGKDLGGNREYIIKGDKGRGGKEVASSREEGI